MAPVVLEVQNAVVKAVDMDEVVSVGYERWLRIICGVIGTACLVMHLGKKCQRPVVTPSNTLLPGKDRKPVAAEIEIRVLLASAEHGLAALCLECQHVPVEAA